MNAIATVAPAELHSADCDAGCHEPSDPHPGGSRPAGPQHMRALERANKVRLARAELKRRIASSEIGVAEVILDCPWEAQSMAVGDLLMSQRRWGHTRCRKFLAHIPMSEQKTVGSMTERQRRTLAAMLGASGPIPAPTPWLTAPGSSVESQRPAFLHSSGRI
jgi:hypothetical protein